MALSSPIHGRRRGSSSSSEYKYMYMHVAFVSVIRKPGTCTCTQEYTDQILGIYNVFSELSVGLFVYQHVSLSFVDCKVTYMLNFIIYSKGIKKYSQITLIKNCMNQCAGKKQTKPTDS